MDEALSHLDIELLESRASQLDPARWRSACDNRSCARLYWVKSGSGVVRTWGHELRLRSGHAYLIPPQGDTAYGCERPMQVWWMHFRATVHGSIDLFDHLDCDREWTPDDPEAYDKAMARLLAEAASATAAGRIAAMGTLLGCIAPFIHDRHAPATARRRDQRRLLPVLRHIDEHLADHLEVAGLARIADLDPSYFSAIFTAAFGTTPMRYVLRRRIIRVQAALADGEATLESIAGRTGFRDAFHLSRAFKRVTGRSPRDFRRDCATQQP